MNFQGERGVIVTQLVTIPIGLAVGRWAPKLPRKPIFLVGFAVLLLLVG